LVEQRGDIHHIFPKKYLTDNGFEQKLYNQVANYVYTEQSTNIKIGKMSPQEYFAKVKKEIAGTKRDITTIDSEVLLKINLEENDMPSSVLENTHADYEGFLLARRKLMASKIKDYYQSL